MFRREKRLGLGIVKILFMQFFEGKPYKKLHKRQKKERFPNRP